VQVVGSHWGGSSREKYALAEQAGGNSEPSGAGSSCWKPSKRWFDSPQADGFGSQALHRLAGYHLAVEIARLHKVHITKLIRVTREFAMVRRCR
jgi:hypothetical protein